MHRNTDQTTILIIDDDITVRQTLTEFLEDNGFKTLNAENGSTGLEMFRKERPSLVLVDLRMAEMDGLEVISGIKALSADTPQIVISGAGKIQDVVEALHRGAWDYLLKPIEDLQILFNGVENALETSRLKQENKKYQQDLEKLISERTQELEQANNHLAQINSHMKQIVETIKSLSSCTTVEDFGVLLLEKIGVQMQATGGSLYLQENDGLHLINALDPGHASDFIPFPLQEDSIFHHIINDQQPILIRNVVDQPNLSGSGWTGYQNGSALAFPLSDESNNIIGILTLHNKLSPPFVEQDKETGSILASYGCEAMRAVRASENLSLSEERFRELAELLPEAVFELDKNLLITYANQRAFELFGYSAQDFEKGIRGLNLIALADRERAAENATKQAEGILRETFEYQALRKDGSTFPIIYHSNLILKEGNVRGLRGIAVDITERKESEQKLEKTQNYLASIIDSMPSLIIGVDITGKVTLWNHAIEKATGISVDSAVGKSVTEVSPRVAAEMDKIIASIKSQEIITETNKPRQTADETQYENITIYPLIAEGEKSAVIRIEDVSEEYDLQEQFNQNRKMDAIGQLAGGVAHDFNNMIGGIMGAAQLLKSKKRNLDEKSLKFVDMIMQASTRAADMTAKLLAVGRRGKVYSASVDIHLIIRDTISILEPDLPENVNIINKYNAEDHIVTGDSSLLLNTFMNICSNADHAMPDGGEITIETNNITLEKAYCKASPFDIQPGPYITIEIRDRGEGIPLELLPKIFEPFYTTKNRGKGSGLGLAAVYGTIQDHMGTITVSSKVDIGTAFHVFLPLEDNTIKHSRDDSEVVKGSGRILLVDDETLLLIVAKTLLEEMGYSVLLAKNGQEAVEIYQHAHSEIDLVILDMIMPVMSGSEAFAELRKIDKDCKVLISSGFFKVEDLEKMDADGLSGFIRKPYQQSELSQQVAKILGI